MSKIEYSKWNTAEERHRAMELMDGVGDPAVLCDHLVLACRALASREESGSESWERMLAAAEVFGRVPKLLEAEVSGGGGILTQMRILRREAQGLIGPTLVARS